MPLVFHALLSLCCQQENCWLFFNLVDCDICFVYFVYLLCTCAPCRLFILTIKLLVCAWLIPRVLSITIFFFDLKLFQVPYNYINDVFCGAPTYADDMALIADDDSFTLQIDHDRYCSCIC